MAVANLVFGGAELLPARLAATLRRAIVEGQIAPGTRLVEADLVRQFGVSRVPLREAFRVLEGEGLITIHAHRGAVISELSDVELVELFAVRAVFEAYAAESLAGSRPGGVLDALEAMVARMRSAVRANDLDAYYGLAAQFHEALVAGSGNGILIRQYGQIKRQVRRYQAAMARLPESPKQSIVEHDRIIKAIRAGEKLAAARAARAHVDALVLRYRAGAKTRTQEKETPIVRKSRAG